MSNCRFTLDEKRNVIDAVNPANSGKGYKGQGGPEDERHLRDFVLQRCLSEIIKKLLIDVRPAPQHRSGEQYQPFEERSAVQTAILYAIRASHLNTFDPALSIQHKFDGKLKRRKKHTQDLTSLALLRDDVECLLRDLYGDLESEAVDSVVLAVLRIVEGFTRCVRPNLLKEQEDAEDLDYTFGIGVPEGCGISGSDCYRGRAAKLSLIHRVREVNAKLSSFSEYTIEFANLFAQRWDCSKDCLDGDPF